MAHYYPFGEVVRPLVQQDRSPKRVFVLGAHSQRRHDAHRAWEERRNA